MKKLFCTVLALAMILTGCATEPSHEPEEPEEEVELTGNVFLDADTEASLSTGGGVRNYINVSKEAPRPPALRTTVT